MPPIDPICLLYAPIVSWVVDVLKRVPFLARYPKVVAALLSIAAPFLGSLVLGPLPIGAIVICALTTFSGAVATHEVVSKPTGLDDSLAGRP